MTQDSTTIGAANIIDTAVEKILGEVIGRVETLEEGGSGSGFVLDEINDAYVFEAPADHSVKMAAGDSSIRIEIDGQVVVETVAGVGFGITSNDGALAINNLGEVEASNPTEATFAMGVENNAVSTITANSGGVADDTLTLGSIVLTLVAGSPANEDEVQVEASAADLAASVLAAITAHSGYASSGFTAAAGTSTTIILTSTETSYDSNSIVVDSTGTSFDFGPFAGGKPGDHVEVSQLSIVNPASYTGAEAGTLLNSPVAGDPTLWLRIAIDGKNYVFPCWDVTGL